jgi:fructosamine-3-kinase
VTSGHHPLDAALHAALSKVIGGDRDPTAAIDSVTEIGGGSISRALLVASAGRRCFVKLNDAGLAGMFAAEADGLGALAACSALRVPRVFGHGLCGRYAYLVLEYLPLQPLRERHRASEAGRSLAALHRIRAAIRLAARQLHRQQPAVQCAAADLGRCSSPASGSCHSSQWHGATASTAS